MYHRAKLPDARGREDAMTKVCEEAFEKKPQSDTDPIPLISLPRTHP